MRSRIAPSSLVALCFAIWLTVHVVFTAPPVLKSLPNYRFAAAGGAAQIRRIHSKLDEATADFYPILMECDAILPKDARIQIVLPSRPTYQFEFLRDRARYLLYPRNYGDPYTLQDHILVYGVAGYEPPPGYQQVRAFGPDKILFSRRAVAP